MCPPVFPFILPLLSLPKLLSILSRSLHSYSNFFFFFTPFSAPRCGLSSFPPTPSFLSLAKHLSIFPPIGIPSLLQRLLTANPVYRSSPPWTSFILDQNTRSLSRHSTLPASSQTPLRLPLETSLHYFNACSPPSQFILPSSMHILLPSPRVLVPSHGTFSTVSASSQTPFHLTFKRQPSLFQRLLTSISVYLTVQRAQFSPSPRVLVHLLALPLHAPPHRHRLLHLTSYSHSICSLFPSSKSLVVFLLPFQSSPRRPLPFLLAASVQALTVTLEDDR